METIKDLLEILKWFMLNKPDEFLWICVITFVYIIGSTIYSDFIKRTYYNDMKKQKDEEIKRLAADNRRYRDVYLANLGLTKAEVAELTASNIPNKED